MFFAVDNKVKTSLKKSDDLQVRSLSFFIDFITFYQFKNMLI